jgi:hypothetical protein
MLCCDICLEGEKDVEQNRVRGEETPVVALCFKPDLVEKQQIKGGGVPFTL